MRFCLSQDGLKLGISRYTPPGPGGRPLSRELLREALLRAGVTQPPIEAALDRVLAHLAEGKPLTGIALVRGIPAREPAAARFEPRGDLSRPVFPGDLLAVKIPPRQPEPGMTIDGRVLAPRDCTPAKDPTVISEGRAALDPDGAGVRALVCGLAEVGPAAIAVRPLLTVTPDRLQVLGTLYAEDAQGRPLTGERLAGELQRLGVTAELERESAEAALAAARETGQPQEGVVLARGLPPQPGLDGWLEFLVPTLNTVGLEQEGGRLDYRERGAHPAVTPGQRIARVQPPQPGRPGRDVFGREVPSVPGRPFEAQAGSEVTALEGGLFQAETQGIVVVEQGVVAVTECLVIHDDVGLATGNVRAEQGSLDVRGSIQAGFTVEVPGHVVVHGVVESATVTAGGSLEVSGGIVMPKGGLIRAGGHVSAQFANTARIEAGGDVVIANEVSHSTIRTAGQLIATRGKGIVQGGTILCAKGLEANELGSPLGTSTVVAVSVRWGEDANLFEERRALKLEIDRIDAALGGTDFRAVLERTPPDKRPVVVEILHRRVQLLNRFKELTKAMAEQVRQRQQELAQARVRVRRVIHPGVTVKIAGRSLTVTQPVERASLRWDEATREIVIGNL